MLRQWEAVGPRAFDADTAGPEPKRSTLAKPLPPLAALDRIELSSQLIDGAGYERALVGVDADEASHHHLCPGSSRYVGPRMLEHVGR